jgi:hypothetical protein
MRAAVIYGTIMNLAGRFRPDLGDPFHPAFLAFEYR